MRDRVVTVGWRHVSQLLWRDWITSPKGDTVEGKRFFDLRFALLLIALLAARNVLATDRYFADLSAESPSKRFSLTAKSPDNQAANPKPFQRSFVYKYVDQQSQETLWTVNAKQLKGHGALVLPPTALFVANEGWCVVVNSANQLISISPTGEAREPIVLLKDAISKRDRERFVIDSSAGPIWKQRSLWYFVDDGTELYFVIRPWWGKRIVVNAREGKLTDRPALAPLIKDYETSHVLEQLKIACESLKPELDRRDASRMEKELLMAMSGAPRQEFVRLKKQLDAIEPQPIKRNTRDEWEVRERMMTAIWLAGQLRIKEAKKYLDTLEQSPEISSEQVTWINQSHYGLGGTFSIRQQAQLAIRRLGYSPGTLPATRVLFRDQVTNEKVEDCKQLRCEPDRIKNARLIKQGMKMSDVIDLLGPPDAHFFHIQWFYFLDASKPVSLEVVFELKNQNGDDMTVERIVKMKPAIWSIGTRFEEGAMNLW